jgi:hypothetical protein
MGFLLHEDNVCEMQECIAAWHACFVHTGIERLELSQS